MSTNILGLTSKNPLLMGILNITTDSFSDGGKYFKLEDAIKHAEELINSGFHIIDVGGESTRPGATPISEEEEISRVVPVIHEISRIREERKKGRGETINQESQFPNPPIPHLLFLISIDTYKSKVAKAALEAGADIINDVSGLTMDKEMVSVARDFNCPVIIMHNDGIPARRNITNNTSTDKIKEIISWLKKQTNYAIENGIKKENIIIDPGIGFGKTPEEDLCIIENLQELKALGYPILIGHSKKSFIKKIYGENTDIDLKTKELTDLAVKNGANIIRVHSF